MPAYVIHSGNRASFIAALRDLADFLTANPRVLVPSHPALTVFVDAADPAVREEVAEGIAAPLGVPLVPLGRGYFKARRDFGPIAYSVSAVPPKGQP